MNPMRGKHDIPFVDQFKLNAIKDPDELVKVAICSADPKVAKAAIDKLMKLDLIHERKALLVCSIVKRTKHEAVARHAFSYCSMLKLPDDFKQRIIKDSIEKIKFDSVKKR